MSGRSKRQERQIIINRLIEKLEYADFRIRLFEYVLLLDKLNRE